MPQITRQRGIRPGRHHVGTPGDIISECPDDFVGIRSQGSESLVASRYRLPMGALMTRYTKKDFPVSNIRMFLEPGPIVLVSSAWKGETNIMTIGWHMVMGEEPSLIGCY